VSNRFYVFSHRSTCVRTFRIVVRTIRQTALPPDTIVGLMPNDVDKNEKWKKTIENPPPGCENEIGSRDNDLRPSRRPCRAHSYRINHLSAAGPSINFATFRGRGTNVKLPVKVISDRLRLLVLCIKFLRRGGYPPPTRQAPAFLISIMRSRSSTGGRFNGFAPDIPPTRYSDSVTYLFVLDFFCFGFCFGFCFPANSNNVCVGKTFPPFITIIIRVCVYQ